MQEIWDHAQEIIVHFPHFLVILDQEGRSHEQILLQDTWVQSSRGTDPLPSSTGRQPSHSTGGGDGDHERVLQRALSATVPSTLRSEMQGACMEPHPHFGVTSDE